MDGGAGRDREDDRDARFASGDDGGDGYDDDHDRPVAPGTPVNPLAFTETDPDMTAGPGPAITERSPARDVAIGWA